MKKSIFEEIIVWVLIAFGTLVFSIFAYIIGTNTSKFFSSLYTYKTVLEESEGVYVGTKVTIHGKSTGNVFKIILLPDGRVEINFTVKKNHAFSVTKASIVQLKNSGALGDRFVNIFTEDLSAPQLEKGSFIPYKPYTSVLSVLTGSGGEAKKSLNRIMGQIDKILSDMSEKGVFGALPAASQKDLAGILSSVKNILQKVESGRGTLGALINDRALYNRLLSLTGQRSAGGYLKGLAEKSKKPKKKK